MNGEFLQGLSSEIFTRLGELRQEQKAKDEDQKLRSVQMLAGLADKVEPDSLPLLLGHVWDTMGIKKQASGKGLRGFLDAFSGTPSRSIEDQLGTKLNEISRQFTGPETARQARAGGDMARLFQPQTPEQQSNQANRLQAERDLQGKLIFRDPRAEKLQDLRETYGLKASQSEAMLQERERLLRERQAENDQRDFQNAWKLGQQRADLKAHGDVLKRASTIAFRNGVKVPTSEHLQQAAEEISREQGLNLNLLKARIGVTEARIPLVEAQTKKAQRPPKTSEVFCQVIFHSTLAFEKLFNNQKETLLIYSAIYELALGTITILSLQGKTLQG